MSKLLDVPQARAALGNISVQTFYNIVNAGRLPLVKIGTRSFVRASDIERFIERSVETRGERVA